jgi:cysteine sulfinate desulfinase/cysteine desulfurase-like protein
MGLGLEEAKVSVRFSLSRDFSEEMLDEAAQRFAKAVEMSRL